MLALSGTFRGFVFFEPFCVGKVGRLRRPAALRRSGFQLAAAPEETRAAITEVFLAFAPRLGLQLESGARGCGCSARRRARAGAPIAESAVVIVVGGDPALGGLGCQMPRLRARNRLANGFAGRPGIDGGPRSEGG